MYVHDPLTQQVIGCAIAVHRALGPGLFEATYEEALSIELAHSGVAFTRQVGVGVFYKGHLIGEHRPDLVVAQQLVVEIKSVDRLRPVHEAQVLTYMRILKLRVGLLLNFNSAVLKTSIRRLAL